MTMEESVLEPLKVAADHRVVPAAGKVVVVITGRSVWVITSCSYLRFPRDEFGTRLAEESFSLWGRLDDDVWHPHNGAYWRQRGDRFVINLRPVAGPRDGYGITTGGVEAAVAFDRADFDTSAIRSKTAAR